MQKLAILLHPGHNRVYYNQSAALARSELEILLPEAADAEAAEIGGLSYLCFTLDAGLTEDCMLRLSRLSCALGLFAVEGEVLRPVTMPRLRVLDESLSQILKYTGKTNEIFTRLLINLAQAASDRPYAAHRRLLDPLCGKGTTLFEGLIAGYDVTGIEIGTRALAEGERHLKAFLEQGRIKHTRTAERFTRNGQRGEKVTFAFSPDRTAFKTGGALYGACFIAGDACFARELTGKRRFDLLAADLPYGVQHGAVTGEKQNGMTRNPAKLIETLLPAWTAVLEPGAGLALAFNTLTLRRSTLTAAMESCGYTVFNEGAFAELEHRVDASIVRDVVAGRYEKAV